MCATRALPGAAAVVILLVAGTRAQDVSFVHVGSIPGPADLVEVDGRTVYVAAGKTLSVVDVSDPAAPKHLGAYTFPELIWGVTPAGSRVYVAADTSGLGILDLSNPATPRLAGSLKTPGQAKNVALIDQSAALVADHVSGIDLVDISTPVPRLGGSFFVDGFAKDVVVRNRLLYAIDQPNGFNIFELSSSVLTPIGSLTLAVPIPLRAQLDVSDSPSVRVAVVIGGGGPVQIYDVSDARKPAHAATYRTPGAAQRVALQGSRLYVADGPAGLQVIDLSMPSMPRIIGAYKTVAPARDVAVTDSLVFVVGNNEVLVLRRAAP